MRRGLSNPGVGHLLLEADRAVLQAKVRCVTLPAPGRGKRVPGTALETDLEEEALLLRYLLLGNVSDWQFLSVLLQPFPSPLRTFRGNEDAHGTVG